MPRVRDKGKVFRDPVHGLIRIEPSDAFILELIDTPEFQRLRRIRQLGVSFVTYHGAEHSRFAHSLGVFNFSQRIINALRTRYQNSASVLECLDDHHREIKAAALLHDVGHGPFSHMIERAFHKKVDHESRTVNIIQHAEGEVRKILEYHGISPDHVADIVSKTHPCRLAIDIVSSQLDADRMDYLLRDSLFTGVEYGRYDSDWILNAMCIGRDPASPQGSDRSRWRLCLDQSRGLYSAEQMIMARAHMTMQVYFHRVTRGFEVLLLNLFSEASKFAEILPSGTPAVVRDFFCAKGDLSPEQWLQFDESQLTAAIHSWAQEAGSEQLSELAVLADAFLNRRRYYVGVQLPEGLQVIVDLPKRLEESGLRKNLDWSLDLAEQMPYKGLLWSARRRRRDAEEASAESILMGSGNLDESAQEIEAVSDVLKELDVNPLAARRLYLRRDKADKFKCILDEFGFDALEVEEDEGIAV
ncbi:MAG: HD domain-containing protein [Phycisphaerales bacterium JB050]